MSKCPIEKISFINEPFEQWAERIGKVIKRLQWENHKFFECIDIIHKTGLSTYVIDIKHNRAGIARCRKGGTYNGYIGVTIAFYRMMGWELPKVQRVVEKHISELRRGDKMFDFSGRKYNCPNCPTMEFVDVYRGDIIVWDIEKQGFRIFVHKDGEVYKVLEED